LLTGTRPFHGKNARQLMMQHCTASPDLSALPETDRTAVARALSKEPEQRFATCTAFVQALEESGKVQRDAGSTAEPIRSPAEWRAQGREEGEAGTCRSPRGEAILVPEGQAGVSALIAELIVEAKQSLTGMEADRLQAAAQSTGVLHGRFPARLSPPNTRSGFETFRRQWNADVVREAENTVVFHVPFPSCFWKRWLEGTRGLLVEVRWTHARPRRTALPEISVRIFSSDKKNKAENTLVNDVGPLVLDSLRSHLEAYPERRDQERVAWPHPVRATFLLDQNTSSESVEGKGKDLSLGGIGLYLRRAFAGSQVHLELFRPSRSESIVVHGHCVRVQLCGDGWFETGVLF
jgi:hypothetical protein